MAVVVAQFAPGADHFALLEKADEERPDDALGLGAGVIAVADAELELLADSVAQQRGIDLDRLDVARR